MTNDAPKATLHGYLQRGREAVLWKLDGLSEYDVRRPMTPTGTNLLGLAKHLASVELGYFGETFGRLSHIPVPWREETERDAGQADIARELIEGSVGLRVDNRNLPPGDVEWWTAYRERLEHVARQFLS